MQTWSFGKLQPAQCLRGRAKGQRPGQYRYIVAHVTRSAAMLLVVARTELRLRDALLTVATGANV
jgi:hypothetical protein